MKQFLFITFLLLSLWVQSQTNGAVVKDSCALILPNVLSPNDGATALSIQCACTITAFNFKLYDRWGTLYYSTDKLQNPLDVNIFQTVTVGKRKTKPKYDGNYGWKAKYTIVQQDKVIEKESTGFLTIFPAN